MIHFPSNNWVLLCPIATNFVVVVDVYLTFIKFVAVFGICWSARDYFMLLFSLQQVVYLKVPWGSVPYLSLPFKPDRKHVCLS